MEQIDFHFHVTNRTLYACRLIQKVTGMGLSVAVWSTDSVLLRRAYDDLWRFDESAFIAHAWAKTPYAERCKVIFASRLDELPASDVAVLLDERVPDDWQNALGRFQRVVDIVSTEPRELEHARARYRIYRDAGLSLKAYDRSKS